MNSELGFDNESRVKDNGEVARFKCKEEEREKRRWRRRSTVAGGQRRNRQWREAKKEGIGKMESRKDGEMKKELGIRIWGNWGDNFFLVLPEQPKFVKKNPH